MKIANMDIKCRCQNDNLEFEDKETIVPNSAYNVWLHCPNCYLTTFIEVRFKQVKSIEYIDYNGNTVYKANYRLNTLDGGEFDEQ